MESFSKTSFGIRDLTKNKHWSNDIDDFSISKVTFICLGGNGVLDTQAANGQAARNERLMGLKPKDYNIYCTYNNIDIISLYYGRKKPEDTVGTMTVEESNYLVDKLFMPLFLDKETHKRLPLDVACKNFSKVIFSSHCYGTECVGDLMYDLQTKLLKHGYYLDEIAEIFSHSLHLSYSPLKLDNFLPFVQINSFADSFNQTFDMDKWFENKFGYKLNGIKITYDKKNAYGYLIERLLKPCQKEICIYTSMLLNVPINKLLEIDEHLSKYIDLNNNWKSTKTSLNAKNAECISQLAGMVLAMAGARALNIESGKAEVKPTNLTEIYEALESVLEKFSEEDLQMK